MIRPPMFRRARRANAVLFATTLMLCTTSPVQAQPNDVDARGEQPSSSAPVTEAIRPFHYRATEDQLADLKRRIRSTAWPTSELVPDASQGVRLSTMRALAKYWSEDYDWRRAEARLDRLPQFMTTIDGVDIHFIHVRSRHRNALPIIVTHGWPGSIIEQMKIVEPLTNPTAHGGASSDAFDVVIPSLPGHGFSGAPSETGWDPVRIAKAWIVLMERLGYKRYAAQGGDWGNAVTEQMALIAPPGLVGMHTNMPATVPDEIERLLGARRDAPADLSSEERRAYGQLDTFYRHGLGYAQEMANRPQTLYALSDSPVGLAAWMLDHDAASQALIANVFDGAREGLTKDDVLDNVTLYWLTRTAIPSARLYWESKLPFFAPKGVKLPVGVSAYPDEIYTAPRSWAEKAYPNLVHYGRPSKGGHFAAWEQPASFVDELRATFRNLR